MRTRFDWGRPAPLTERDVIRSIEEVVAKAASIGMPIAVCAIRPSDENRIIRTVVRGSADTPGLPSTEELTYLASTVVFDCTKHVPDEARALMLNVIVEFAEEMRYRHKGGTIPPHMLGDENAPPLMGDDR